MKRILAVLAAAIWAGVWAAAPVSALDTSAFEGTGWWKAPVLGALALLSITGAVLTWTRPQEQYDYEMDDEYEDDYDYEDDYEVDAETEDEGYEVDAEVEVEDYEVNAEYEVEDEADEFDVSEVDEFDDVDEFEDTKVVALDDFKDLDADEPVALDIQVPVGGEPLELPVSFEPRRQPVRVGSAFDHAPAPVAKTIVADVHERDEEFAFK